MKATTTTRGGRRQSGREKRARIMKALGAAIAEANEVTKRGHNALGSYDYARAEDMIAAAKEILARHRLRVLTKDTLQRRDEAGDRVLVQRWGLLHEVHGETEIGTREWPVDTESGRDLGKAYAAAVTSSLAYFLRDLLQLPRTEKGAQIDDDRTADNMPSEPALRAMIAAHFDALGVPDEQRAEESRRLIGKHPEGWSDLLLLCRVLRERTDAAAPPAEVSA